DASEVGPAEELTGSGRVAGNGASEQLDDAAGLGVTFPGCLVEDQAPRVQLQGRLDVLGPHGARCPDGQALDAPGDGPGALGKPAILQLGLPDEEGALGTDGPSLGDELRGVIDAQLGHAD